MLESFQFGKIPKIIFGKGCLKDLPVLISKFDKKIVLVTGNSSFMSGPYASDLLGKLESAGMKLRILKVAGEPSPGMIDNAVSELKDFKPGLVVSIGGGSVLDAGKAISAMINVDGSISDYLEEIGYREHTGIKLPFIAIPTTSGTGSEATKNAVISKTGNNGFKKSLRHDNFVPDVALIDPSLTIDCPPGITASSGMDCFTQLTEAYLSTKANVLTDSITFEGVRAVKNHLYESYVNGDNINARSGMSFAALASGIGLANAGLGTVHGIAGAIGGLYEIPHGLLCGTLMAVCNEITVRKLRKSGKNPGALKKYAALGEIFCQPGKSDDYYIDGFISSLHELTIILKLSGLKSAGLREADFGQIIEASSNKNNPVQLNVEEMDEILTRRYV